MLANSCFMSNLTYMVELWGGTASYIIRVVQVIQNEAARCVTRQSWFNLTMLLLLRYNWLSRKQLIFFHAALQVWSVRTSQALIYIFSKLQLSRTGSAAQGNLLVPVVEKALSSKSFMVRSADTWNMLPPSIRSIKTPATFKIKMKQ